jgi:hypothetical protein
VRAKNGIKTAGVREAGQQARLLTGRSHNVAAFSESAPPSFPIGHAIMYPPNG